MIVEDVELSSCESVLKECFMLDEELINKYHIFAGRGLDACVQKTAEDMRQFSNYVLYVIKQDETIAAFFGREKIGGALFMTGFCIKPEFRTKEFIGNFWDAVKNNIAQYNVYASIYKKNIPAQKFLSRKGSAVYDNKEVVTFKIF